MKARSQRLTRLLATAAVVIACAVNAQAQIIFTDNFDSGASPLWSNLRGAWFTSNGAYLAANPQNVPPTFTGLPFVLQNFAVDVDITKLRMAAFGCAAMPRAQTAFYW